MRVVFKTIQSTGLHNFSVTRQDGSRKADRKSAPRDDRRTVSLREIQIKVREILLSLEQK